jgi:hypothetical protein
VVLADELSYVLSRDKSLSRVFIVDNEAGQILKGKLARQQVDAELIGPDELNKASMQDRFTALIWMNTAGPHDNQTELRVIVKNAAAALKPHTALCLCFYGLCRNSLWKIGRLGEEVGIPMMILTDQDGKDVDDCFGANMGGKKAYLEAIRHDRGTIFVTPGYAENWQRRQGQKDLAKVIEQVENMRFVFERMAYSKVMRLENGLGDKAKFEERVDGFAKIFDLQIVTRACGLGVFEHSYSLAKAGMSIQPQISLAPAQGRSIAVPTPAGPLKVVNDLKAVDTNRPTPP